MCSVHMESGLEVLEFEKNVGEAKSKGSNF
jgi:hypothetical protein